MNTKIIYKVYCSNCKKHIGDFENVPTYNFINNNVRNKKQPYIYSLFKEREDGISYIEVEAFCCKECEKKYVEEFNKK